MSADRDQALKMHDHLQKRITQYFVRKGCADSQELFSETRQRVIDIINNGGKYDNPQALFFTVARNVWLEDRRKPKHETLEEDIPKSSQHTESEERKAFCLDHCLARLPEPDRGFIIQYYEGSGQGKIGIRKGLAARFGSDNIVRIKAFRIRVALRACITDCLTRSVN